MALFIYKQLNVEDKLTTNILKIIFINLFIQKRQNIFLYLVN
jgi:hypothetical protein